MSDRLPNISKLYLNISTCSVALDWLTDNGYVYSTLDESVSNSFSCMVCRLTCFFSTIKFSKWGMLEAVCNIYSSYAVLFAVIFVVCCILDILASRARGRREALLSCRVVTRRLLLRQFYLFLLFSSNPRFPSHTPAPRHGRGANFRKPHILHNPSLAPNVGCAFHIPLPRRRSLGKPILSRYHHLAHSFLIARSTFLLT